MNKREHEQRRRMLNALESLGFTPDECDKLRRISMTLRRWFELECGNSNDYGSWAIERDDNGDGPPFMVHHHYSREYAVTCLTDEGERVPASNSKIFRTYESAKAYADTVAPSRLPEVKSKDTTTRTRIADREAGARKRLAAIIEARNKRNWHPIMPEPVSAYVQGDPRGAALYILRPGDVPEGADAGAYYSRGICVY